MAEFSVCIIVASLPGLKPLLVDFMDSRICSAVARSRAKARKHVRSEM
jgi:hypothetical protein